MHVTLVAATDKKHGSCILAIDEWLTVLNHGNVKLLANSSSTPGITSSECPVQRLSFALFGTIVLNTGSTLDLQILAVALWSSFEVKRLVGAVPDAVMVWFVAFKIAVHEFQLGLHAASYHIIPFVLLSLFRPDTPKPTQSHSTIQDRLLGLQGPLIYSYLGPNMEVCKVQ